MRLMPLTLTHVLTMVLLARAAQADLLVGDWNNHQVLRFNDSGALVGVFGDANSQSGLGIPGGIARDSAGRVYVKDITNGKIWRFGQQGELLGAYNGAGTGNQRGLQFDRPGNLW